MIAKIGDLDPRMQGPALHLCRRCVEDGIAVIVLETHRLLSTHIAYHLRGRAPVVEVRAVFARCGLWVISDTEAETINTQTLYSKHIDGLAMDIAPAKDGKPWWAAPQTTWEHIWTIAEDECGLDACAFGKWNAWQKNGRPWDLGHIEWRE
jgi:hypothetical protein